MLISGLPGVIIGGFIIVQIPDDMARFALGILTIMLGVYSIFSPQLGMVHRVKHTQGSRFIVGGLILFIIGIYNTPRNSDDKK